MTQWHGNKRMRLTHISQFLLFIFLSMLLSGCSKNPAPALRIGINAWPGYEYLTLAEQMDYYKDEGVKVKLIPFQTLADGRRAFEKGHIDIMAGTLMEFYSTREVAGINPVVFLVADFSKGGDMLLAHKSITSVADLKGKKLGLEAGSVDVLTAANALASAQLGFDDVTLVSLPQPNNIKALLAGDIDAAQTYPPFATKALANPNIVRLFDTSQTPGDIIDIIFTRRSIVAERKDDLAKIARAFERAIQYQNTNSEDAIARMAKRQGLTSAEFIDALSGLKIINQQEQANYLHKGKLLDLLSRTHSALISIGVIKKPVCGRECFTDVAIK
jgi:NitT/TauT family transport system substrate-binding protein